MFWKFRIFAIFVRRALFGNRIKVDCSKVTFKLNKQQKKHEKYYPGIYGCGNAEWNDGVIGGKLRKDGRIWVNSIAFGDSPEEILDVVSHESLHKILTETVGRKASKQLDEYLRSRNHMNQFDTDSSGLDLFCPEGKSSGNAGEKIK